MKFWTGLTIAILTAVPVSAWAGPGSSGGGGFLVPLIEAQRDRAINGIVLTNTTPVTDGPQHPGPRDSKFLSQASPRANELYSMKTRELWKSLSQMKVAVWPDDQARLPREASECFQEAATDRIECAVMQGSVAWAVFEGHRLQALLDGGGSSLNDFIFIKLIHLGLHFAVGAPRGVEVPSPWFHEDFDEVGRGLLYLLRGHRDAETISGVMNPASECASQTMGARGWYDAYLNRYSNVTVAFELAYPRVELTGDCASWMNECLNRCRPTTHSNPECVSWCVNGH